MLITFNRHRRARAAVAVVAGLALQACYSYVPLAPGATPRTGERVRAVLTPAGSLELARYLGPNVAVAEGRLSSVKDDGSLVVAVDQVRQMNGISQPWSGEGLVTLPREQLSSVEGRAYQRTRSIVAGSALAVALVGIAVVALRAGGAGGDGGNPPPPPPP